MCLFRVTLHFLRTRMKCQHAPTGVPSIGVCSVRCKQTCIPSILYLDRSCLTVMSDTAIRQGERNACLLQCMQVYASEQEGHTPLFSHVLQPDQRGQVKLRQPGPVLAGECPYLSSSSARPARHCIRGALLSFRPEHLAATAVSHQFCSGLFPCN